MPVVTASWSVNANTNWITSTGWVSSDPSFKVHQQLSAWVTGIGNTSIINIQRTPNDATTKSGADGVGWVLQTRDGDTGSDWGIMYHTRRADTSSSYSTTQSWSILGGRGSSYYGRTPGTANNGYGTFTDTLGNTSWGNEDLTVAGNFFTAYETSGTLPWFVYAWENSTRSNRRMYAMFRLSTEDLSPTSYYPSSGISKWLYLAAYEGNSIIMTPIKDVGLPLKGMYASGSLIPSFQTPRNTPVHGGFFYRTDGQYGDVHYLGKITSDLLVSNQYTGVWGDTIVINSTNYTCLGYLHSGGTGGGTYWIKSS